MHERLLDHFANPRNTEGLGPGAISVEVSNPICGDILRLSVLFEGDNVLVSFRVRGCVASIAAGSAVSEWLRINPVSSWDTLKPRQIEAELGELPPQSHHAATLCTDAVRALLDRMK